MLTSSEIERRLGPSTVKAIEAVIEVGVEVADRSANRDAAMEALQCLLLSLLAAVTITPVAGATQRAELLGVDLVELVEEAVEWQKSDPRRLS